jgi:hypothetical protein
MRVSLAAAFAAALSLSGCVYGPPGPGYARPGYVVAQPAYYDAYYDGYYGPFIDGYWGPDASFYYYSRNRWWRDNDRHFRRYGGQRYVHVHGTGVYRRH